jgi:hypothetical protein
MATLARDLLKRRKIGPAHERSPLEEVYAWGLRSSLFLISSVVIVTVFMVLVNTTCDSLLPTITGEGDGAHEIMIGSNNPLAIAIKLLGGAAIIYLLHKQSVKR